MMRLHFYVKRQSSEAPCPCAYPLQAERGKLRSWREVLGLFILCGLYGFFSDEGQGLLL
jgi:hypothetical protein